MIEKLTFRNFNTIKIDNKIVGIETDPKAMANAIEILMNKINELIEAHNPSLEDESLSYQERERAWIIKNGIKAGSKVRVLRSAVRKEKGWNNDWVNAMDLFIWPHGSIFEIEEISNNGAGIMLSCDYYFPYFVLEPVK